MLMNANELTKPSISKSNPNLTIFHLPLINLNLLYFFFKAFFFQLLFGTNTKYISCRLKNSVANQVTGKDDKPTKMQ